MPRVILALLFLFPLVVSGTGCAPVASRTLTPTEEQGNAIIYHRGTPILVSEREAGTVAIVSSTGEEHLTLTAFYINRSGEPAEVVPQHVEVFVINNGRRLPLPLVPPKEHLAQLHKEQRGENRMFALGQFFQGLGDALDHPNPTLEGSYAQRTALQEEGRRFHAGQKAEYTVAEQGILMRHTLLPGGAIAGDIFVNRSKIDPYLVADYYVVEAPFAGDRHAFVLRPQAQ